MELDTQLVAAPVCCAVCVPLAGREAKKIKLGRGETGKRQQERRQGERGRETGTYYCTQKQIQCMQ
jgi:hypothetical protein